MAADNTNVLRFALGSKTGLRSPSFRVWTARHRPDFYVSVRDVASIFKVTIHAPRPELGLSQRGHAATTADFFHRMLRNGTAPASTRFAATWPGKEVATDVWLHLHLLVPAYGLREYEEDIDATKPVTWIVAPSDHQMLMVTFCTAGAHVTSPPSELVLGGTELPDGRRLVVLAHYRDAPAISELVRLLRAGRFCSPVSSEWLRLPSTRGVVVATDGDVGTLIDVPGDMFAAE